MKPGCSRVVTIVQIILLLWCTVLLFSGLQKKPIESNVAIDYVNTESPSASKSTLRGGKAFAAQDCDKVLGKNGWDFVIGCESRQCAVVQNVEHYDKEKYPTEQTINSSLHKIWNAVIHSQCIGNSFCELPLDPFIVDGARFPTYDDQPRNALGACIVTSNKRKSTKVEWWKHKIDTIGDKKKIIGPLSRISFCYVGDSDTTRNIPPSNDAIDLPYDPASDIGDFWVMGSSGEIFSFPGRPGTWYNAISDDDITYNWFLSECSKSLNHGDEQGGDKTLCLTGIGLMIDGKQIRISVVDPHRMADSCKEIDAPENCISGGNLEIFIDGTPHNVPGNFEICESLSFSAANLPWGCKRGNSAEQPYVKQRKAERRKDRDSRELWGWLSKGDSFRDRLIRETAHGLVWDRMACKGWLWNADDRRGGIYTMSGKFSTIQIKLPTLNLLIEHHVWVGTEQQIMHRFDTYIKQYTRTGEVSFGIQGATLDVKQPATISLNSGSYRTPDKVPIANMIDVVGGGPENFIVGGPFESKFLANLQHDPR